MLRNAERGHIGFLHFFYFFSFIYFFCFFGFLCIRGIFGILGVVDLLHIPSPKSEVRFPNPLHPSPLRPLLAAGALRQLGRAP